MDFSASMPGTCRAAVFFPEPALAHSGFLAPGDSAFAGTESDTNSKANRVDM